jgi:SAM-dependent methyltransferase
MPEDQRRLYGDLAWTWPIISPPEHYVDEAGQFRDAIRKYARIEVKTLLDLGCGGGHNDWMLKKYFAVTGVDISEAMLALARNLNPEVTCLQGDMRTVRLGRTFAAVMIADSIDYMLSEDDLRAAFATAYTHLNRGGVFCTYAEVTRESFRQNQTEAATTSRGDVQITFIENCYDPDASDTTYENTFVYLIRRGGQLEIQTDRHLGGVFPVETWHRLLQEVGFEVNRLDFGDEGVERFIPMFACVRP